jgi:hypothetical protein
LNIFLVFSFTAGQGDHPGNGEQSAHANIPQAEQPDGITLARGRRLEDFLLQVRAYLHFVSVTFLIVALEQRCLESIQLTTDLFWHLTVAAEDDSHGHIFR